MSRDRVPLTFRRKNPGLSLASPSSRSEAKKRSIDLGVYSFDGEQKEACKKKKARASGLSWSQKPDENFSDWAIVVTLNDARSDESPSSQAVPKTYHVHRCQLGAGSRQSQYFKRVFSGIGMSESATNTSEICLEPSAAASFPAMLDFLYSARGDVAASTETAVALRHLSTYFGIEDMFDSVNTFIRKDLNASTVPIYLSEAFQYCDDNMIRAAAAICAENLAKIDSELLLSFPPKIFAAIVTHPSLRCSSEVLSQRVSNFCRSNPDVVEATFLKDVTCDSRMPVIHEKEALSLLELALQKLPEVSPDDEKSLYARCVNAAVVGWKDVLLVPEAASSFFPQNFPSDVKVDILQKALHAAKGEISKLERNVRVHRLDSDASTSSSSDHSDSSAESDDSLF